MQQHYKTHITQQCDVRGIALTEAQREQLLQYLDLLLYWRQFLNLTGVREPTRLIDVLLVESLEFLQLLPPTARVLDLGTGAGVPGIPLAICRPELRFTLLDRSTKKTAFLQRVITALHLEQCQIRCATAEELSRRTPAAQRFDVVVSRGVGHVTHLLRLTAPLLRPGGTLLLRKPNHTAELADAASLLTAPRWEQVSTHALPQVEAMPWMLLAVVRGRGTS